MACDPNYCDNSQKREEVVYAKLPVFFVEKVMNSGAKLLGIFCEIGARAFTASFMVGVLLCHCKKNGKINSKL